MQRHDARATHMAVAPAARAHAGYGNGLGPWLVVDLVVLHGADHRRQGQEPRRPQVISW